MLKSRYFCGGSILAVALAVGLAGQAAAQDQASTVEEVVVTGSFIAGTPEDAAQPVDVIGVQELAKQGAPSVVQLVKTLTAAQSSLGESNRYNGGAGTASINLRGLGSSRTLVLMNGRRLADTTAAAFQGGGADLNFMPTAAIGRIEILKDGAAATYGSDAVAGVVNFLTRKDLDGFEFNGNYAAIKDSDGDWDASLAYGKVFDSGNVLLTVGYRGRGRLDVNDRDFARVPFESVFYGGWSGSASPGSYGTATGAPLFRDNGCNELGSQQLTGGLKPTTTAAGNTVLCRYQFSAYNDLVNEEHHYQLYGEVNFDLSDNITFHGEVAWNRNAVPDQRLSPANLTTQFPTPIASGGTSGALVAPGFNGQSRYFVPANNPGLIALRTTCAAPLTAAQCAGMAAGVTTSQASWRLIGVEGHPLNADGADYQQIEQTQYRISGGLNGRFEGGFLDGIGWDTALTFMENKGIVTTNDLLVNRIQRAFNGLGGPGCDYRTGTPGVGPCKFLNPFSNGIAVSATNDAANPYYQAAVANDPQMKAWLYGSYTNVTTNQILVADAVINGETEIALPGGNIAWAAGAQFRFDRNVDDWSGLGDVEATPCVDSIDGQQGMCTNPTGPFVFFGAQKDYDVDRRVGAVFAEVKLPLLENLEIGAAVRHEDFGGNVGSTTNPRVSARWQAIDWLAVRASAGSTFRAPGQVALTPGSSKGVRNLGGSYRATVTANNPDLEPETAKTINLGVLVDIGGFSASVDYWKFDFEKELIVEDAGQLFAAINAANCAKPAFAARFVFTGACSQANVLVETIKIVNGQNTKTSGFDLRAQYEWDNVFGMDFHDARVSIGAEATLLKEYKRTATTLLEDTSVVIAPAIDRAGKHDLTGEFFSFPKVRANAFINATGDNWNLRYQLLYREGTTFAGPVCVGDAGAGTTADCRYSYSTGTYQSVGKLDDYWQHDLTLRVDLPWETTATVSVQNLLDTDPPFAQSFYNYDVTNGNPLGRVFKFGVKKAF
ncbi:TonB-dependent receptor domain-containing protein [Phenylobacterium sp.]|uniref:TonB-dependent receptor domain-containing protein n=1 Tax=Phenylobacterium sp. TaxID=1871053 RepID=UPI0027371121|nr:TonB-dependent receptor [Phenylobacterium sp.]MDP3855686.1 TonB-dependent receptor [Phenylobacterium sp.]